MPQRKKPQRRYGSGRKAKQNIGIYIFAAISLFIVIIWISQPVSKDNTSEISVKKTATKEIEKVKDKLKIPEKLIPKTADVEKKTQTEVEKGIFSALKKLHITEEDIQRKKKDGIVTFTVPIDPDISDLTFANMIFKGEIEKLHGIFETGIEKGRRQYLTFRDSATKQKYILELLYKHNEDLNLKQAKVISIIVDDFGNNKGKLLSDFAKTNKAVCFAIMPDTPYATEAMKIAKQYGHESIIHVPMEPVNYPREDPGDNAIFIQLSESEVCRRMERFINQLPDCIGVNNHMGSLATTYEPTMQAVMQTLRKHEFLFVDSRTSSGSLAYKIAQKNLVPALKRDIFLDEPNISQSTMDKKLSECLTMAQTKPFIIAIMHCHTAEHLNYLNNFIAKAKNAGFELVPISKLGAYKLPEIQ